MSRVKNKNTRPELAVRRFLHSKGFRYRLHCRSLPGCPDLVFKKYRTIIFVNGCFWHHHKGCKRATLPTSRTHFWKTKILGNVKRDAARLAQLKQLRWKVLVIWECQTDKEQKLKLALKPFLRFRS